MDHQPGQPGGEPPESEAFTTVDYWYVDFTQTTDREVRELLRVAQLEREAGYHAAPATIS